MLSAVAGCFLVSAPLAAAMAAGPAQSEVPRGYQKVTSAHGTYEYVLPSGWGKDGLNSHKGPHGRAMEQLYPAADATAEYCRSFGRRDTASYRSSLVEAGAFDNGHVRGCYSVRDVFNLKTKTEWRHVSFRFPSVRGVEDVTIVSERAAYDEVRTTIVRDSIRMRAAKGERKAR